MRNFSLRLVRDADDGVTSVLPTHQRPYICMSASMVEHANTYTRILDMHTRMSGGLLVCMCGCTRVCLRACKCVCVQVQMYLHTYIPGGLLGSRSSAGSNTHGLFHRRCSRYHRLIFPLRGRGRGGCSPVDPRSYFALGCCRSGRRRRGILCGRHRGRATAFRVLLLRICLQHV